MKNDLSKEILNAAKELNLEVSLIGELGFQPILNQIERTFLDNRRAFPLWERMSNPKIVQDSNAWNKFHELIGNKKTIIFFEKDRDNNAVLFSSGMVISQVLSQCTGFVFYLTDLNGSYLVAFNDHNMLLTLGHL